MFGKNLIKEFELEKTFSIEEFMEELKRIEEAKTKKEAKENTKKWLTRLGIAEYENRKLDTLSKGNQQKVQSAQTLVCNPSIVILD